MTDNDTREVEAFRREFMQFEKRFEASVQNTNREFARVDGRFNGIETKVDKIPWLLLTILGNLLLTLVSFGIQIIS